MANHQSVAEILQKAKDEQARKLASISALATAREAVITTEHAHKKRFENFKKELERELKSIKDDHARAFQAALTAGNSPTELHRLGLSDPRTTKQTPRKRATPAPLVATPGLEEATHQPGNNTHPHH